MDKELVRFIRNVFGLTQQEFGKRLGYSKIYITLIEKGVKPVTNRFENKLKQRLNMTDEDMVLYKLTFQKSKENKELV